MTPDQQDLLQALAFLYLRHGQNRRALTLILLAARDAPDDVGILRTLAYAFVANDAPEEALDVIERLEKLDFGSDSERTRRLLKARALLHAGRRVEAKAVFRQFVGMRRAGTGTPDPAFAEDAIVGADAEVTPVMGDDVVITSRDGVSLSTTTSARAVKMK